MHKFVLSLPLCRLFSDAAVVGVVAHELAHAFRAAKLDDGWLERMKGDRGVADQKEENRADAIASAWGFGKQISSMRKERTRVLNPYLAANEMQILGRIEQRNQRQDEQTAEMFANAK